MKILKHIILALAIVFGISSCGTSKYATLSNTPDLSKYKYVCAMPTNEKKSFIGATFGQQYGLYGYTTSNSINPAEEIAGRFMLHGFVRLNEIKEEQKPQTIVVSYGQSSTMNWAEIYTVKVTIQLLDATSYELICSASAEGTGEIEANAIRKATKKCLDAIFK